MRKDPKKLQQPDPRISFKPHDPRIKTGPIAAEAIEPDTGGWLTRIEAADSLKMSVTTIASHERRGKLHPAYVYRRDSRGIEHRVSVYDPKELIKLLPQAHRPALARDPGEVAARCFELFNDGKSIRDVVIEMRETPDRVQGLYESWSSVAGVDGELTITRTAKEALEKFVGPFSDVTDLVSLVEALVKQVPHE